MPGYSVEDRVLVAKLWDEGWSGSEIAFGAGLRPPRTRNAILGLLDRMGLLGDSAPTRRLRRPRPASISKPLRPRPVVAAPVEPETPPVAMMDLNAGQCRWPVGEASGADQLFCGRYSGRGPYCDRHSRTGTRQGADRLRLSHTAGKGAVRLPGRAPQPTGGGDHHP